MQSLCTKLYDSRRRVPYILRVQVTMTSILTPTCCYAACSPGNGSLTFTSRTTVAAAAQNVFRPIWSALCKHSSGPLLARASKKALCTHVALQLWPLCTLQTHRCRRLALHSGLLWTTYVLGGSLGRLAGSVTDMCLQLLSSCIHINVGEFSLFNLGKNT